MNAVMIGVIVGAISAIGTFFATVATIPRVRAEAALKREDVNDRQLRRILDENDRLSKEAEYLRNKIRDHEKRLRHHREGWWRVYRAAVEAGVELPPEADPPINGDSN